MLLTLLVFLLILTVLVLIHELGHFLVARKFGIKVEEFGFGFPPKALSIKKGETEYSINWLPIGGFVKLYGEDEAGAGRLQIRNPKSEIRNQDTKRAFYARPWQQRAAVVVAGVVMNLILAVVIYYGYLFLSGFKAEIPLITEHKFFLVNQKTETSIIVSDVAKDSPAEEAGIKQFAKILKINDKEVVDTQKFIEIIDKEKGNEVTILWQDQQTQQENTSVLTPRTAPPKGQGAIGIAFFPFNSAILTYDTPEQKVFSGVIHPANLFVYNAEVIGRLISVSVKEKTTAPIGQGVAGPVGIFGLVGSIVEIPDFKEKIMQILNLAGVLSLSLAFFNLLPIPALDGGRLFFILAEGITGKKVNQRVEGLAHTIGMAVLLFLILLITLQDLGRLFK